MQTYFTPNQSDLLLKRFPNNIELSYETISHKKASSPYDVCLAIPQSKKYYAWFTFFRDTDVCILMELNREKKIGNISIVNTLYHHSLSYGTILYGSLIGDESNSLGNIKRFFVIEDLLMYKGISLRKLCFGEKLGFLYEFISKSVVQKFDTSPSGEKVEPPLENVVFSLPIMWAITDYDDINTPNNVSYPIHHIQYRSLTKIIPFLNVNITTKKPYNEVAATNANTPPIAILHSIRHRCDFFKPQYKYNTVFQVTADLQFDIYHLHTFGQNNSLVYYDVAYIPNYKTSVFMNGLFRNIKENKNIDYIEESDDEEDFQDIRYDKYVNLTKVILMECCFHTKFKRWVPLHVVSNKNTKIVHISKLLRDY